MLMPRIFNENLFEDLMDFPFKRFGTGLMKTDIRETGDSYELDIDLPGFKKEEIKAELNEGYLTIKAETASSNEEKDQEGRYIRKERSIGSCSRTFFIGDGVKEEEIKAKYDNGILKLSVPKMDTQPKMDEKKYIAIEG